MKNKKIAIHRVLCKYGPILTIWKSLIIKWLRFFFKKIFIWVYNLIIHHILSLNNKFGMWINIFFFILWCFNQTTTPCFFISKVHYYSQMKFLLLNNHTVLSVMKLLVWIQVLINKSKDILIITCIWIKGTQRKNIVLSQKWAIVACIYPHKASK